MHMTEELLRPGDGRFFRGNLHCHSDRSDGHLPPRDVAAAYRQAGCDFLMLSDHFEERYGWRVTDTRDLRAAGFTTIVGAELSSGDWRDRTALWVAAAGLPLDFGPPPADDPAQAIRRAHDSGAFVVLLHPGLNNLSPEWILRLPELDGVDAVEIFNHSIAISSHGSPDGGYMADALLERGRRILLNAGDDAHFSHPRDRFGAWIEVWAEALDPEALLASLKAGTYYSTQGPQIEHLERDNSRLRVATSPANAIALGGGGDRWLDGASNFDAAGGLVSDAEFDLTAFIGSYCRVTVTDPDGRRAWSNPVWA
jgi:hypothetical protein